MDDIYQEILDKSITHISVQDLYDQLILSGHLSPVDKHTIQIIACPHCKRVLDPSEYSAINLRIQEMNSSGLYSESEKNRRKFLKMLFYDIRSICPYCFNEISFKNHSRAIIVIPDLIERSTTIEKALL